MAGKTVISENQVRDAIRRGMRTMTIAPNALVTPLAADTARAAGLTLQRGAVEPNRTATSSPAAPHTATASPAAPHTPTAPLDAPAAPPKALVIGSDHGGYAMKAELIGVLEKAGYHVLDVGTDAPKSCDYPDFAYGVARMVATGRARLGIMIDGAGIGSAMVCNKVPGIRAACAYNEFTAWNARAHNNANVLTLGSRTLGIEVVKRIVDTFLRTDFEGGRHAARLTKLTDIEARFARD